MKRPVAVISALSILGAMLASESFAHATAAEDEQEAVPVHLGPNWYLENQDVKFAPKDKLR